MFPDGNKLNVHHKSFEIEIYDLLKVWWCLKAGSHLHFFWAITDVWKPRNTKNRVRCSGFAKFVKWKDLTNSSNLLNFLMLAIVKSLYNYSTEKWRSFRHSTSFPLKSSSRGATNLLLLTPSLIQPSFCAYSIKGENVSYRQFEFSLLTIFECTCNISDINYLSVKRNWPLTSSRNSSEFGDFNNFF